MEGQSLLQLHTSHLHYCMAQSLVGLMVHRITNPPIILSCVVDLLYKAANPPIFFLLKMFWAAIHHSFMLCGISVCSCHMCISLVGEVYINLLKFWITDLEFSCVLVHICTHCTCYKNENYLYVSPSYRNYF